MITAIAIELSAPKLVDFPTARAKWELPKAKCRKGNLKPSPVPRSRQISTLSRGRKVYHNTAVLTLLNKTIRTL